MRCPNCQSELKKVNANDVEIDVCPKCEGIWFDGQELQKVAYFEKSALSLALAPSWDETPLSHNEEATQNNKRLCPRCGKDMNRYRYQYSSGVWIDGCPDHGVWLDDGELKAIHNFLMADAKALDPKKYQEIVAKIKQIKAEEELKEQKRMEDLVKIDDSPAGKFIPVLDDLLQWTYSIFYKIGL